MMLGLAGIIVVTLIAAALAAVAQYLYKKSVKSFRFNVKGIVGVFKNSKTLLGIGLYLASLGFYLYALYEAPIISFVYPVFASTFIFVLLISKYVLKERITTTRLLGVLMVMAGIIVVSLTFPK